jgi:RNA polymerase sigma-70 factor (ECF subfamily)
MQGDVVVDRNPDEASERIDDAALIAAVARGDKAALGALYDRHCRVLLALGCRILGDHAVAEDVLHDVFLEAWHQAAGFDPARGSARAWLVTRMRSRALDRRAASRRQARLAADAGREGATDAAGGREAAAALDGERVRDRVAGLAPELGTIVELAYFEGLSSSEIAARLAIPTGTVKSRMARALAALKHELVPGEGGAP